MKKFVLVVIMTIVSFSAFSQSLDFILKSHSYTLKCAKEIAKNANVKFKKTFSNHFSTETCQNVTGIYHFTMEEAKLKKCVEKMFEKEGYTLSFDKYNNPTYSVKQGDSKVLLTLLPEETEGISRLIIQIVKHNQ